MTEQMEQNPFQRNKQKKHFMV